jgi:hypothetical protein
LSLFFDFSKFSFLDIYDIIIFPKIDSAAVPTTEPTSSGISTATFVPTPQQKQIILIDVTFTDDSKVKERYQHKLNHHNPYFTHLQSLGCQPIL